MHCYSTMPNRIPDRYVRGAGTGRRMGGRLGGRVCFVQLRPSFGTHHPPGFYPGPVQYIKACPCQNGTAASCEREVWNGWGRAGRGGLSCVGTDTNKLVGPRRHACFLHPSQTRFFLCLIVCYSRNPSQIVASFLCPNIEHALLVRANARTGRATQRPADANTRAIYPDEYAHCPKPGFFLGHFTRTGRGGGRTVSLGWLLWHQSKLVPGCSRSFCHIDN